MPISVPGGKIKNIWIGGGKIKKIWTCRPGQFPGNGVGLIYCSDPGKLYFVMTHTIRYVCYDPPYETTSTSRFCPEDDPFTAMAAGYEDAPTNPANFDFTTYHSMSADPADIMDIPRYTVWHSVDGAGRIVQISMQWKDHPFQLVPQPMNNMTAVCRLVEQTYDASGIGVVYRSDRVTDNSGDMHMFQVYYDRVR